MIWNIIIIRGGRSFCSNSEIKLVTDCVSDKEKLFPFDMLLFFCSSPGTRTYVVISAERALYLPEIIISMPPRANAVLLAKKFPILAFHSNNKNPVD